jgi:hypothetical protein
MPKETVPLHRKRSYFRTLLFAPAPILKNNSGDIEGTQIGLPHP